MGSSSILRALMSFPHSSHPHHAVSRTHHVIPSTPITSFPAHPSRHTRTHHVILAPITPYPAHPITSYPASPSRRIPHPHHVASRPPITPYPAPPSRHSPHPSRHSRTPITPYPAPPSRHSRVGGNLAVCDRRHIRGHTLAPAKSLGAFAEWFMESASSFPPTRE